MIKKLDILGYTYRLDISKTIDEMEGNVGYADFDKKTLEVARDVDVEVRDSTLLHEIIEAINYHLEIELTERQIKQLEVGLYYSLSQNNVSLAPLTTDIFYIPYTGVP